MWQERFRNKMRIMVPRVAAAVSAQETEKLIHMVRVHLEQAGACLSVSGVAGAAPGLCDPTAAGPLGPLRSAAVLYLPGVTAGGRRLPSRKALPGMRFSKGRHLSEQGTNL